MARWQSGHAAACKAVYAGSIPTLASIAKKEKKAPLWRFIFSRIRHVLSRYVTRACLRFLAGVPECVHCYEGG